MARTNIPLDPTRTGLEAKRLETSLRALVIGQDEAIEQVVERKPATRCGICCSAF